MARIVIKIQGHFGHFLIQNIVAVHEKGILEKLEKLSTGCFYSKLC